MPDTSATTVGCTCFTLRKLTRTVSRLYDLHLAAAGMKTTQYSLLRSIAREALPVAGLAARLATERTTLTRTLKPLIDAGWVVLSPGADSRQRIVTITAAGLDAIKSARQAWRSAQTELETALGTEAVRDLHRQLDSALLQLSPLLERSARHANED
ncbi:MAG: winged helix-turn-helix transcriptional regulator [Betaproteobacteria bacterium]|nr:winged helix-turn-helix transcriptional regulator [Betaproteobacteria bacterium]